MASGRPIIASDVPAIRDVFDESMGYFFEPDNPVSLASAIRLVFNEQYRAEEKGKRARLEVQKYSWEERAADIKRFIEKLYEPS
jgi:glycosyltransferase involved in cell wall biosynthesis